MTCAARAVKKSLRRFVDEKNSNALITLAILYRFITRVYAFVLCKFSSSSGRKQAFVFRQSI